MDELSQEDMANAADIAEKFVLADFGGNDIAGLRNGICGDSAIEDFVRAVSKATLEAKLAERDAIIIKLGESAVAAAKQYSANLSKVRKSLVFISKTGRQHSRRLAQCALKEISDDG